MKKLIKTLLVITSLLTTATTSATQLPPKPIESCTAQTPYGQPVGKKLATTLICRSAYLTEHDNNAKIPIWVSYVLEPQKSTGCVPRTDSFEPDQSLPNDKRAELKDYAKSGYDIGHMGNSADMAWDVVVQSESFILSNAAPQLPGFNRGIWKKLEDQTRAWALGRNHTLLIYTGPLYSDQDNSIGKNIVRVPHGFYKIIIDTHTRDVLIFTFKHEAAKGPLTQFITSLAKIQKDTGITFPMPRSPRYSRATWPSSTKSVRAAKKRLCTIG